MEEVWLFPDNARGREPFSESILPALVIDENDVGVPNIRNRSTHQRIFHTFTMIFNDDEWADLKYWVRYNLQNGIGEFRFPRVDNYTSDQSQWELYRFALEMTDGGWYSSYEHSRNRHKVVFTLELL